MPRSWTAADPNGVATTPQILDGPRRSDRANHLTCSWSAANIDGSCGEPSLSVGAGSAREIGAWHHGPRRCVSQPMDKADRLPSSPSPGPGQESVWDYPRPPRVAADAREVLVGSARCWSPAHGARCASRNGESAHVLSAARRHHAWPAGGGPWLVVLRVEGACALLVGARRWSHRREGRLELSRPVARVRGHRAVGRVLREPARVLRRR